jgi:hypothetical protein
MHRSASQADSLDGSGLPAQSACWTNVLDLLRFPQPTGPPELILAFLSDKLCLDRD